jgi:septal ring factor EnvC (AmiA/AmiB activator)
MCKKVLVAAVAVILGVLLVTKTPAGDLVRGWWSDFCAYCKAEKQARDAKEPPEKRIEHLRGEIGKIRGEVLKTVDTLVKMKLDVEEQEAALRPLDNQRTAREKDLREMTAALEEAGTKVSFQNATFSKERFKAKVVEATEKLNVTTSTLESRRKALQSKKAAVDALDKQIRKMQEKEQELNALADRLEAKLQELHLKKLENSVAVDNSKVSECEELAKQIERMLKEEDLKADELVKYNLTNAPEKPREEPAKSDDDVLKAAREALNRGDNN